MSFSVEVARSKILVVGDNRAVASCFRVASRGLQNFSLDQEFQISGLFLCFYTPEGFISAIQINFDPYTLLRQSYSILGSRLEEMRGSGRPQIHSHELRSHN